MTIERAPENSPEKEVSPEFKELAQQVIDSVTFSLDVGIHHEGEDISLDPIHHTEGEDDRDYLELEESEQIFLRQKFFEEIGFDENSDFTDEYIHKHTGKEHQVKVYRLEDHDAYLHIRSSKGGEDIVVSASDRLKDF